jgi:ectoine hydroxylase-related dioxygenase (phytanoyl-CoA dioxygenase family)
MSQKTVSETVTNGPLTNSQIELYHQTGYLHIKGLFNSDVVEQFASECVRLEQAYPEIDETNLRAQSRLNTEGKTVFDRFDPIKDISSIFAQSASDPTLVSAIGQLFSDQALLFKDKLIFKRPGTHGYRIHQDYTYWCELPCPPEALLSVLIAIDASSAENGALEIYPGAHHEHIGPSEKPHDIFNPNSGLLSEDQMKDIEPCLLPLNPGDALIFHSLAPHRSGINHGTTSRRSLYYSYNAGKYGDLYDIYYKNFHGYLRSDRASHAGNLHFR